MNSTVCVLEDMKHFELDSVPFYFSHKANLIAGVDDRHLTLAAPVLAYWILSLLFHLLDNSGWKWLDKYRLHESEEVKSGNRATPREVFWAVLVQHLVQTVFGLLWLSGRVDNVNPTEDMKILSQRAQPFLVWFVGQQDARKLLPRFVYYIYWWTIPSCQFILASFVIDTWQYFMHRFMHVNKFLYKTFHSVHHRLYIPYAYGALYNHPVEGFFLDTVGAGLAEMLSCLSTRQAMFLFVVSTCKTVDDHCGYSLPFDPLQLLTKNNADYHDIHHQTIGIKSNFSQPFFIHWDALLGTRMTRRDIELRKRKQTYKAE